MWPLLLLGLMEGVAGICDLDILFLVDSSSSTMGTFQRTKNLVKVCLILRPATFRVLAGPWWLLILGRRERPPEWGASAQGPSFRPRGTCARSQNLPRPLLKNGTC